MEYNFNEVEVSEGLSYITPGVVDCKIESIEDGVMPWGDNIPSVEVTVESTTGATHTEKFNMSPIAKEGKRSPQSWSIERLKSLGTKIVSEEEFNKCSSTSDIATALVGKSVRIKFVGREYEANDGSIKSATDFGFRWFAESIDTNPSRLTYDPNNNWDFKRLPKSPEAKAEEAKGDLPF
jgi:hypothetical protein